MERKVLIVCSIVGFMGILSAALAFAAEATRIKASDVQKRASGKCEYPKSAALSFGLGAAISLMIAQAIINTVSGCLCCKRNARPANVNWSRALILSWITFVVSFLLLLSGAALNDQRSQENMYSGDYCYVVKPGIFSGGAVLSLASVALGIFCYFTLSLSKRAVSPQQNQGISMGQPVIPPQSAQPVFVHEDTYNRQQIP